MRMVLWIKDSVNNITNIINTRSYSNLSLKEVSITSLDDQFQLISTISAKKASIGDQIWLLKMSKNLNLTNKMNIMTNIFLKPILIFEKISSLFSNLAAFNVMN